MAGTRHEQTRAPETLSPGEENGDAAAVPGAAPAGPISDIPNELPAERAARRRRLRVLSRSGRRSLILHRVFSWALMVLVVFGAAFGGLYWRLSHGPLTVPFLTNTVREAILGRLPPGYQVDLNAIALEKNDRGLTAVLNGLVIGDSSGPLASAPRVVVDLDTASLMTLSVSPRSIVVDGAAATINVSAAGQFSLRPGVEPTPLASNINLSPLAFINTLDVFLASAGTIDAVELHDATLAVHDLAIGRNVVHRNINLTVRRTAANGGLSVALAALGGTVNATVAGSGSDARTIDVHAGNLALREIASAIAPGAEQPEMSATFDALLRARIEADGSLGVAEAHITSEGGTWDIDPEVEPFRFDGAEIDLHWDKVRGAILLDQAMVKAGQGMMNFQGSVLPPSNATNGLWKFDLKAPDVLLAPRQPDEPPLKIDAITIAGRYDPATDRLGIDKGEALGPTASLAFAGSVTFGSRTPGVGLGIVAHNMSGVALSRLWPVFALPKAKAWMEDHIKGGTIDNATLSLAIPTDALAAVDGKTPPLPDEAAHGEIAISGGTLQIVDTLPPLSDVAANVTFSGRHLAVVVPSATVDTGANGSLDITDGAYAIEDFAVHPARQTVAFSLSGPSRAIADLLTHPPLSGAVKGLTINPDEIDGKADLKIKLDMPLIDHPRDEDIHYNINGEAQDLSMAHVSGGRLEDGSMKVVIEPGLLLLTGKAIFDGLPANIDLRKASDQDAQIAMTITIDDALRKKKGFDFGDALTGPVVADIEPMLGAKDSHFAVNLDLTAARIKDLLPGWQKAAGKPAKASFTWDPAAAGGTIEDLALDSGTVSLRGDVALTPDNKVRKAVMSSIRLSSGDDFQGTFEPETGGWKISLRGTRLDARPLLASLQKRGKTTGPGTNVAADIQIDKVMGYNDEAFDDFVLALDAKGTTIRQFRLKGSSSGGDLTANLVAAAGGNQITAQSSDAGSVMRFLDYYTHLRGGELSAAVTPVIDNMRGELVLRNFAVENETALGQYRNTLKNSGKSGDVAPQAADSARFTKLHLVFTRTASRIGIVDSVVWGPDVGVSLSGDIDYGLDNVNLTGTFVPAYALNNIFGQIPVLGAILGGGQYGGLFAINFKVAGRINAPVLTVNPLSAIAPGFLRKIFEFQKQKE